MERLAPPWQKLELLARSGGIRDGATVSLRTKFGPCWIRWDVKHSDYVEGVQFRDVQVRGPFSSWEHLHRFEAAPGGLAECFLTDELTYKLPAGMLGRIAGGRFVRAELERLFAYRHAVTKADIESTARYVSVRPLKFLIAGASGLVGRSLIPFLLTQGHAVVRLVRRPAVAVDEITWDPAAGELSPDALKGVDAVINLSGEGVADSRWSPTRKKAILDSRVHSTRTLVRAMAALTRARPFVFISGSATGFYGDRDDEILDENSSPGSGFLAGVCNAWEREACEAEALGIRVVRLRTGVVLTPTGGALARLLPVFLSGLGGRLSTGKMWMSWIAMDDLVGAIYHAVLDRRCDGAVNATAPAPVTNTEFTRVLGRILRRPVIVPVPSVALKAVFGAMAGETLLASAHVMPTKLQSADYVFRYGQLEDALRHLLGRTHLIDS
ncbi:MAG TPA: TIGR01777 family oxidoreductase [Rariglobus sp.]|nr:TIGR01777 family oxidoreductase [Rariglobus sp.]